MSARGLATAGSLILIALTCIAIAKRLERERRFVRRLREEAAVSIATLSDDERETAEHLRSAGVVRMDPRRGVIEPVALREFQRKRLRFALTGALIALALGVMVAYAILR